jgi:two-component system sensor histidine kinase KdpD
LVKETFAPGLTWALTLRATAIRVLLTFRRGDPSRQEGSSGFGLAVAKAIVELHGGTISAENNPGKGTTVKIKIPS